MTAENKAKGICVRIRFYSFYILLLIDLILLLNCCQKNHIKTVANFNRSKHFEEAIELFIKVLKTNPDSIDLKIDIDRLLRDASDYYYYIAKQQEKLRKPELAIFLYKNPLNLILLKTLVGRLYQS